MKKLFLLSMAGLMLLSFGCNRDDFGGDQNKIQREEEMNRGDTVEDDYDQSDLGTGSSPANIDDEMGDEIQSSPQPTQNLEEGAPSHDPSEGLDQGAPRNIQQ